MIERLLEFSVRQRALVLVLTAVFVVLGFVAFERVPIDAVPDVTNVQVQVITAAPALGPLDVETYVTFPVEAAMAGLPRVSEIRSVSRAGISVVTVAFDDDMGLMLARQVVGERLSRAREQIPKGYGTPELGPPSSGLGEVLHFEVTGGRDVSLMDRRAVLDWQIAPRLRTVPGVVDVNVFGGESRTLELSLDPTRLAAAHLGVADVQGAIERDHLATGGAYLIDGREHVTVRGDGRIRTPADLGAVSVETRDGTPLYIRDLGEIHFAPRPRYGAVTRDGRGEAVVGVAMMLVGANAGDVVSRLKETLDDVKRSLPPGVGIDIYYDRTDLVARTIHTVRTNLLEAGALVILVLLATLGSFRAGALVAVAIPLALVGVFVGMWQVGVSGNLLSLGAIDFGLVVDGAIIIVENAQRRLALRRGAAGRPLTPDERRDEVLAAAREVRSATAFGEAIIALVYVPLLALEGVEGRMFRPMALTVLFALGTAFFLSLTVVPALASLVLSRDGHDRPSWLMRGLSRVYEPVLHAVLRRPKRTMAVAVVAFALSLVLGANLGREFLPKLDEGSFVLATVRLPSVSLEQATTQTTQMETTLKTFPEVTSVVSRTGRAEIAIDPMGMNMTDVYVLLQPRSAWKTATDRDGLIHAFDRALSEQVPGAGWAFTQPIEMNTNDLLAGISSDLALHIYGDDLAQLRQTAERTVRILRGIPGAQDVRSEQIAGANVLDIRLDRAALGRYGVHGEAVLATVAALGGIEAGTIVDGAQRYPIQLRFEPSARASAASVSALPVRTPDGITVPLGQLATVRLEPGPSQVSRERLQRRTTVELNVRGRDIASFVTEARRALDAKIRLPVGYSTAWAGEYERLQTATRRLAIVVPMTLALILVLLIATFGELRPALVIFLNVPMAVTGGLVALAARSMPLSISAAVGFIALFGVAVLNGLVLVSSMDRAWKAGGSLPSSIQASIARSGPRAFAARGDDGARGVSRFRSHGPRDGRGGGSATAAGDGRLGRNRHLDAPDAPGAAGGVRAGAGEAGGRRAVTFSRTECLDVAAEENRPRRLVVSSR